MTPELPPKPSELCRFRTFAAEYKSGKDELGVYDLLRGRLRFADVRTFNDPFEARPQYVAAFTDAGKQRTAMLKYIEDLARERGAKQPRRYAEQRIGGRTMQEVVDEIAGLDDRDGMADKIAVYCLSEPKAAATPLPWSHYADSHKGVCVHLDTSVEPLRFSFPVKYCEEYPRVVVPRTEQRPWEAVQNKLLSKCEHWKYEHEWRCIRQWINPSSPSAGLLVQWDGDTALAPAHIVKAVTLGAMMPEPVRMRLRAWVQENVPHVEVWQAHLHRSRYEVVRQKLA